MTTYFQDNFTETDGTPLEDSVPEVGASWEFLSGTDPSAIIRDGELISPPTAGVFAPTGKYKANPDIAYPADLRAEFKLYMPGTAFSAYDHFWVCFRGQSDGERYAFMFFNIEGGQHFLAVYHVSAGGSLTQVGSNVDLVGEGFTSSGSGPHDVSVDLAGNGITIEIDGDVAFSGAMGGQIEDAGNVTIESGANRTDIGDNSNCLRVDDFTILDSVAAGGAALSIIPSIILG